MRLQKPENRLVQSLQQVRPIPAGADLSFIPDDTEAGRLVRQFNWAATPLESPETWSPSLRMMVRFLLANRFPMLLWWGPQYIQIYNDPYAPILGTKHPSAMGLPTSQCWSEIWDVLKPLIDTPFNGGPATWMEDIELAINRHGFVEESHFTVAYSPVPDETAPRGIGGVLATVHEITEKVIGERRVRILRELGARVAEAKTDQEACATATTILSQHPKDAPFALLYLLDEGARQLRLVSATGIDATSAGPGTFDLDTPMTDSPWPLAEALRTETTQVMAEVSKKLPRVPQGPWSEAPNTVAVVPIKSNVAHRPAGALVMGISSRIRLDQLYSSFLDLVGAQIATAVANARAYEEERRRAAALAEIDRAKTAFFSNVSHEFRTPLTLMLGPIEEALSGVGTAEPLRTQLDVAHRNALRLLKLVNSLLDFARIEAGRVQASFEPVDFADITADLASTFRSAIERAGLSFEVQCPALGEPVYVDREMWEKIVLNLLSNAFKYTLSGRISVKAAREGDQAVLEVSDTGVGVPEHALPHLFERFYRVESTNARTHEGSGIGLALVQELVRIHGGSIEAQSTLGVGTTLRVRIPFGTAHLQPARIKATSSLSSTAIASQAYVQEALRWLPDVPTQSAQSERGALDRVENKGDQRFASTFGARILLADDNADMRAYLRDLLGPTYHVEVVRDGEEALAAARRERPDLILSDVMMPQLDGFGLIEAVRADPTLLDVPIILLSARAGEESRIEGLNAGADDYIVKPFVARELLARVGALLELTNTRRENEERFRAYVQATSDVVYRMNADWSEMRQLQGRDFIADTTDPSHSWMQKYIYPDDQPRVMAAIQHAVQNQTVFELEHRVIRADGSLGWTFSRAIPLLDKAGKVVEWFGAASDVTEHHRTQEALLSQQYRLQTADRQKDEFLAMLAHELRNPLAPIRNAGELLARTSSMNPHARSAVATIERQVTHLTRLVDDLLDVSRITKGRIELRRRPTSIADVMTRALETVDPLIQQKHHNVVTVSSRQPLVVNADPERLLQCMANILTNAAKFTPAHGEIRIELRAGAGEARVIVSDNGMGISPELLPQIFDLFVQGERTLDRAQGGLGIGLSIVKRVIEMHEGSVAASSGGINQGATFEIVLPLVHGATTATEPAALAKPTPRRILVVDDNEDAANTLGMILKLEGHHVEITYSGSEAFARAQALKPEIVLLDIGLPGLDGYEVAKRLRSLDGASPACLVAITGYGQEADRQRARAAGFAEHLVKPIEFAALQRILAALPTAETTT
jgi:signal transduction histidine kinase